MWLLVHRSKISLLETWRGLLVDAVVQSRFTADVIIQTPSFRRGLALKIERIRLRRSKDYCGQHPGPCLALNVRPHKRSSWLEGSDWVGWNALVNDVLDRVHAECDVFSFNRESLTPRYYVRRGRLRRVGYPHAYRGRFAHWLQGQNADFADHCGKTPPTLEDVDFDRDTPGLASYCPKAEVRFLASLEQH